MVRLAAARCAVVQLSDGLVVNIIIAEPTDLPPADCELIEIPADQFCDLGWYWTGTEFIPPLTA